MTGCADAQQVPPGGGLAAIVLTDATKNLLDRVLPRLSASAPFHCALSTACRNSCSRGLEPQPLDVRSDRAGLCTDDCDNLDNCVLVPVS